MAPPAIAKIAADLEAEKNGHAPGPSQPPSEVTKPVQKPAPQPKFECFPKLPAEIQQMIWVEFMQKPACHSFRFLRRDVAGLHKYTYEITNIPTNRDPSAYLYWKSLLWNRKYKLPMDESEQSSKTKSRSKTDPEDRKRGKAKPEKPKLEGRDLERFNIEKRNVIATYPNAVTITANKPHDQVSRESFTKLANLSFQAGFERSMVDLDGIIMTDSRGKKEDAGLDVATDLVILEFDRGEKTTPNSWFEHRTGDMWTQDIREKTDALKRIAVHYKRNHAMATRRSPWQCWCQAPSALHCEKYKACPLEQAHMLDCFAEMKEFYYIVEVTKKKELAWLDEYKVHARRQDYKLKTSEDSKRAKFELAHFYDMKKEYLQLCPKAFTKFLPEELRNSPVLPLEASGDARDCLTKVLQLYRDKLAGFDAELQNSLEDRKKVKFGILISYSNEN